MAQPNEVVDLAVALFLTPIIVSGVRGFVSPARTLILAFVGCLLVALSATIAEGFLLYDLFNTLEHAMYAIAGTVAAAALVVAWRSPGAWRE
ncbi:MAG: hypothetical protein H5T75_00060 [Coriobacteriia bacterium]|nr:hypothetical protein [Coriobacteriia bacterium]